MTKDVLSLVILSQGRRVGLEGRAETGTRFIRRESEVGAGRNASYELFSGAMCCWVTLASWS